MNAWFPGGAIQAIIGNIDPLCGEAESFRRLLCEEYLKMQAPNVAKLKRSIHGSRLLPPSSPELKGSIGEGPNHSNFSDQSSVKILAKFKNFGERI